MPRLKEDPYEVLGLSRGADKKAVKTAFRNKAMQTHPDLNSAADAAEQYTRIRKAAETILGQDGSYEKLEYRARPQQAWGPTVDRISRKSRFPAYFSAACLVCGCFIFLGALHAHNSIFDRYSYYIVEESERRRSNPSPEQQRIQSLLTQRKEVSRERD